MMEDQKPEHTKWYHLIDAFRGFALLNMLFFHFYYDVYVIFGQDPDWYHYPAIRVWQQFICMSFLIVSGMSWHFSRNNLKRGIQLNLYGLLITAVTGLVMPDQAVRFGILNCIGCCTLLMIPVNKVCILAGGHHGTDPSSDNRLSNLLKAFCGLFSALLLFLFTRNVSDGYLSLAGLRIDLEECLYSFRPMTILGFPYTGFRSSDYFPLLPWFFLFLFGYWLWEVISCSNRVMCALCTKVPVLSRLGQRTIWIYLLHQPLLYGMAYLLIIVFRIKM